MPSCCSAWQGYCAWRGRGSKVSCFRLTFVREKHMTKKDKDIGSGGYVRSKQGEGGYAKQGGGQGKKAGFGGFLGGKSGDARTTSKSTKYNPDAPAGKSMGEVRDSRGGSYNPDAPKGKSMGEIKPSKGNSSPGGGDNKKGGIGSGFMRGLDRFGKWGKHHPDRSVVVSQRPSRMMYSRTDGPGLH
jgi:hypothetical protein